MSLVRRVPITASVLLTLTAVALTQEPPPPTLQDWVAVSSKEAGLVLIIDAPVTSVDIFAQFSANERKEVARITWPPSLSVFVHQFRLEPGDNQFRLLQGPIANVGVVTRAETLTYLRLSPYRKGDDTGANIVVTTGPPPQELTAQLDEIRRQVSYAYGVTQLRNFGHTFQLNTEPPWPIPPPPPKK
jgi:hypothetical protein